MIRIFYLLPLILFLSGRVSAQAYKWPVSAEYFYIPVFYYNFEDPQTPNDRKKNFFETSNGKWVHYADGMFVKTSNGKKGLEIKNDPITAYSTWWLPNNTFHNRTIPGMLGYYKRAYTMDFYLKNNGLPITLYLLNSPNHRIELYLRKEGEEVSFTLKESKDELKKTFDLLIPKVKIKEGQSNDLAFSIDTKGWWFILFNGTKIGEGDIDKGNELYFTGGLSNRIFIEGSVILRYIDCIEIIDKEYFRQYGIGFSKEQIGKVTTLLKNRITELSKKKLQDIYSTVYSYVNPIPQYDKNLWSNPSEVRELYVETDYESNEIKIEAEIIFPDEPKISGIPFSYTIKFDNENGIEYIILKIQGIDNIILKENQLKDLIEGTRFTNGKLYFN